MGNNAFRAAEMAQVFDARSGVSSTQAQIQVASVTNRALLLHSDTTEGQLLHTFPLSGVPATRTFFGTVVGRPVRHTPLVGNPYQKWLSCQALRHRCSAYPFGIPLVGPVRHRCSAYPLEGVLEAKGRLDFLTVPNYFRICDICRRGGM